MKKLVTRGLAASALAVGLAVAPATAAFATDYSVSMDQACAISYGSGWKAILVDNTSAYGWKCYAPPYLAAKKDVKVQDYCVYNGLGTATVLDPRNPYSWRCRT